PVAYDGPYPPLRNTEVSAAFDSVMRLSFEVRAGLLMRQIHHWAAVVLCAAGRLDAADPPLGGGGVRRGHRRPRLPDLLHGGVPSAARDQLARRGRPCGSPPRRRADPAL